MSKRSLLALVGAMMISSCESGLEPHSEATLSLRIASVSSSSGADAGTLHLEGPSPRTVSIQPGQTVTVEDLLPGTYTVTLEAFVGGQLESLGQTNVTVVAGQDRQANITLRSFVPAFVTVTEEIFVGESATIQIASVQGAASYVVEWSSDPDFAGSTSVEVSGISTTIPFSTVGDYYVRARARSRFGSLSLPSPPASLSAVAAAPTITRYDVFFRPVVTSCGAFQGFRTEEELDYIDSGDFLTSGPLVEPIGIESQFRFEGQPDWTAFFANKAWTFVSGSNGFGGTLEDAASTCWVMPSGETYVDLRVRVQDGGGNWSDWFETRLFLPSHVTISPDNPPNLLGGESQQLEAEAHDINGDLVPGDPINWSSYNGPAVGSISADGLYTLAPAATGFDRVYARAGEAFTWLGVTGPFTGSADSWWAPCWGRGGIDATAGNFLQHSMTVFAGREYLFRIYAPDPPIGSPATGDPDLYVRMGAKPTTSIWDAASLSPGIDETITWTAPSDGIVWFAVHAFTDYTDIAYTATTNDSRCGFPGFETLPPSSTQGMTTAPGPPVPEGGEQ